MHPLVQILVLSKNKDSIVSILQKGRSYAEIKQPLITLGGSKQSRQRVLQVSKMAALLEKNGVRITGEVPEEKYPYFIPSACWREIAPGIHYTIIMQKDDLSIIKMYQDVLFSKNLDICYYEINDVTKQD